MQRVIFLSQNPTLPPRLYDSAIRYGSLLMACAICRLFFSPSLLPHNPRAAKERAQGVLEKVPHEASDTLKCFEQEKWISLKFGKDFGCSANMVMPSRHFCIAVGTCLATISSGIISGYWMGPDVEDGWGYVEAAVDRIF